VGAAGLFDASGLGGTGMAGFNRYTRFSAAMKTGSPTSTCVFISHKLSDLDVAKAVGRYLTETVNVDIYLSDSDEDLQQAVKNK
jgi:hypothetical protein